MLGPYIGTPTEHVRIPYGKGICGQVAKSQEPLIVQDIVEVENYLSCNLKVKAEMVIPILKDGQFVAELDVDSHQKHPFKERDKIYLNEICQIIAGLF